MKKKLIEVALPLDAINVASAKEKSIRHGHPSTLHLWWARRPLAAARAVIFAQMVDDPSAHPDLFPTEKKQEKERQRLFRIIEELVKWENTTNEDVLDRARAEIWESWRRACAENADHPRAKELFDRHKLPAFHDPFAGGGTLPLEAQRLGLEAHASDLNPVAVLINKAMIEIPPKFAGRPPVNPEARAEIIRSGGWHGKGAQGLAIDVRYYGKWMRNAAEERIGYLYPKVEITAEIAKSRMDLRPLVGERLTVIAWLWARTIQCPNPACRARTPLARSFWLSTKVGGEVYAEPVLNRASGTVVFSIQSAGQPPTHTTDSKGARCLFCDRFIQKPELRKLACDHGVEPVPMALVCESDRGRVYLPAIGDAVSVSHLPDIGFLDHPMTNDKRWFSPPLYGLPNFADQFTRRQLVALTTFSDLVQDARGQIRDAAVAAGLPDDAKPLRDGGVGATAYSEAVGVYLSFCVDKGTLTNTTQATWQKDPDRLTQAFARQAVPMVWDYAEANPLSEAGGGVGITAHAVAKVLERLPSSGSAGSSSQQDAAVSKNMTGRVVSTDPPYFDNIGYADLSDFFYVWLRRSVRQVYPELFATVVVPKAEELVATPHRHGGKDEAEAFFLKGMTQSMSRLAEQAHPAFPVTIYYAFKQSETGRSEGTTSTGWETFLDAVFRAGFMISGTWPVRTELTANLKKAIGALASSIILVCRPRPTDAPIATRREFINELKADLPAALAHLQRGNIAPVDLAQAAIGPGMAVYTRYSKVVDAEGKPLSVGDALALINQTLDEALAEQEGDFDADSRWAVAWFEQSGFAEGEFGVADVLARAKNTSVEGMVSAGILESSRGRVRILKPAELPMDWDPVADTRLTAWETVHHLIRVLEAGGEAAAADLVAKLGSKAEPARELTYRLYAICERKKRATEALAYNGLVQSWPEITRLAHDAAKPGTDQPGLFG